MWTLLPAAYNLVLLTARNSEVQKPMSVGLGSERKALSLVPQGGRKQQEVPGKAKSPTGVLSHLGVTPASA